ncbi:probable serine/threonine-protein kinase DDB_G0283337 [Prorops nasuta]|uniref:probable serine/threonine-protein kinase DDB_G0283337 n=1 Tax=Prorops nasuta TaxID=863751 RepID=UPI0034CF2A00
MERFVRDESSENEDAINSSLHEEESRDLVNQTSNSFIIDSSEGCAARTLNDRYNSNKPPATAEGIRKRLKEKAAMPKRCINFADYSTNSKRIIKKKLENINRITLNELIDNEITEMVTENSIENRNITMEENNSTMETIFNEFDNTDIMSEDNSEDNYISDADELFDGFEDWTNENNSDEDESEDENLNDDDNQNDNSLIHQYSQLTIKESACCILSVVTRHNCTKAMCENNIRKHFYCKKCNVDLTENENCLNCGQNVELSSFIEIPLINQIKSLFLRKTFVKDIQHRFNRNLTNDFADIYDGEIYKELDKEGEILNNKINISFTCLPILFDILEPAYVTHYVLFVSSIYLLMKNSITRQEIELASRNLHKFISQCEQLYGKCHMTCNIHSLLHLSQCVIDFGPLWVTSCFPFESLNGSLKKFIRSSKRSEIQISSSILQYTCLYNYEIDNFPELDHRGNLFNLKKTFKR